MELHSQEILSKIHLSKKKRKPHIFRELALGCFLTFVLMLLVLPSFSSTNIEGKSWLFIFLNALIGVTALVMIFVEVKKSPYSLNLIHWIFNFMFFFIAPIIQYLNSNFPWYMLSVNENDLLINTNLIILAWQYTWIITRILIKPKKTIESKPFYYRTSDLNILFLFLISFIVLLGLIYTKGVGGLFTRQASGTGNEIGSSAIWTVLMYSGRAVPIVLFLSLLQNFKNTKSGIAAILILPATALIILTNFPTSVPRFWLAALGIGLLIHVFRIKGYSLVYILILGLLVLFPLFGSIRNAVTLTGFVESLDFTRLFGDNMLTADYDAFSMIAYTQRYVDIYGITFGNQILTVLLFFVPRSIWPDKSFGSGYVVANGLGFHFNNVSSPLPAEGFINFGLFGVMLFAMVFAMICTKLDFSYRYGNNSFIKNTYPFWIGLFFFMSRGDLLSSFSFMVGFTICFYIFKPKKRFIKQNI